MTTTPTAPATATGPFAKFKALLRGEKKHVAPAAEQDTAAKDSAAPTA